MKTPLNPKVNNNPHPLKERVTTATFEYEEDNKKGGYNIVEDMKRIKANITLYELAQINTRRELILKSLTKELLIPKKKGTSYANLIIHKGEVKVPPFLLTMTIFGNNLYKCLIYLGASANVIPIGICKKLKLSPIKSDKIMVELDNLELRVMGELLSMHMQLASKPRV